MNQHEQVLDDILQTAGFNAMVVYTALKKLGPIVHMRVMDIRKHLTRDIGESTIKKNIKMLSDLGYVEFLGETHDSRGRALRVK